MDGFGAKAFSIMTLSIVILSIMTFSVMARINKSLYVTLGINDIKPDRLSV